MGVSVLLPQNLAPSATPKFSGIDVPLVRLRSGPAAAVDLVAEPGGFRLSGSIRLVYPGYDSVTWGVNNASGAFGVYGTSYSAGYWWGVLGTHSSGAGSVGNAGWHSTSDATGGSYGDLRPTYDSMGIRWGSARIGSQAGGGVFVSSSSPNAPALVLQLAPGQAEPALQVRNSSGVAMYAIGPAGNVLLPDGSMASPGLSFLGDPTSGFRRDAGNNNLIYVAAGVEAFRFNPASMSMNVGQGLAYPAVQLKGFNAIQNGNGDNSQLLVGPGFVETFIGNPAVARFSRTVSPNVSVNSGAPNHVPFVINLAPGQAEPALEVRNSSGSALVKIYGDGSTQIGGTVAGSPTLYVQGNISTAGRVRVNTDDRRSIVNVSTGGIALSSGNLAQIHWSDSATTGEVGTLDAGLARSAAGVVKVTNGSTGLGAIAVGAPSPATVPVTINLAPGQAEPAFEVRNSSGVVIHHVDATGRVVVSDPTHAGPGFNFKSNFGTAFQWTRYGEPTFKIYDPGYTTDTHFTGLGSSKFVFERKADFVASGPENVPITIRLAPGQAEPALEVRNSSGVFLSGISAAGRVDGVTVRINNAFTLSDPGDGWLTTSGPISVGASGFSAIRAGQAQFSGVVSVANGFGTITGGSGGVIFGTNVANNTNFNINPGGTGSAVVTAGAPGGVPFVIRSAPAPSVNQFEIRNSSDVAQVYVNSAYVLHSQGVIAGGIGFDTTNNRNYKISGAPVLNLSGTTLQVAPHTFWTSVALSPGNVNRFVVSNTGAATSTLSNPAAVGVTIKLAPLHTGNAFEIRNSSDVLFTSFGPDGRLVLTNAPADASPALRVTVTGNSFYQNGAEFTYTAVNTSNAQHAAARGFADALAYQGNSPVIGLDGEARTSRTGIGVQGWATVNGFPYSLTGVYGYASTHNGGGDGSLYGGRFVAETYGIATAIGVLGSGGVAATSRSYGGYFTLGTQYGIPPAAPPGQAGVMVNIPVPGASGIVIDAAPSQTAPYLLLRNSSQVEVLRISSAGHITSPGQMVFYANGGYSFSMPIGYSMTMVGMMHIYGNYSGNAVLTLDTYGYGTPGAVNLRLTKNPNQSVDMTRWQTHDNIKLSAVSKGGYFKTKLNAAPPDDDLENGEAAWWFTATDGAASINFRAKTAGGAVVSGSVPLAA